MIFRKSQSVSSGSGSSGQTPPLRAISLARPARLIDWKRVFFLLLGVTLFMLVYFAPPFADAIDPKGEHFVLNREGKAALGLFLWAST